MFNLNARTEHVTTNFVSFFGRKTLRKNSVKTLNIGTA